MTHDPKFSVGEHDTSPVTHCGRMDRHEMHPLRERILDMGWVVGGGWCHGAPIVEGGSLETHDCGARVHPSEIRKCCRRCTGTVCPECEPCRRVS